MDSNLERVQILFEKIKTSLSQDMRARSDLTAAEGAKFELIVFEALQNAAIGTIYEGKIDLVSGQKFPDIVINKSIGLEVKTTRSSNWTTTGNSVFEGTRVGNIEKIYLLCAKFSIPFDIVIKPYEECLTEIVVTHSPRYLIDMKIAPKESIFNKMNITYDELRQSDNPIRPIIDYYKTKLREGQSLWWIDEDSSEKRSLSESNLIMTVWNTLEAERKNYLCSLGYLYFPELLSKGNTKKYSRFSLWLVTTHNIICNNVRDLFSAGGTDYLINPTNNRNVVDEKLPRIFIDLFERLKIIRTEIESRENEDFLPHWENYSQHDSPKEYWVSLVEKIIVNEYGFSKRVNNKLVTRLKFLLENTQ